MAAVQEEVLQVHEPEDVREVPVKTRKIDPKDPPRFWDRVWAGMPDPAPYGPLDGHKGGIGIPAGEAAYAVKKDLKKQAGAEEEDDKDEEDKKKEKRKGEKPAGERIGGNVQNGQNPLGL
ncbi:hypothetical protein LTR56_008766 [Elasticomyces elasticus]|nr:hypothetical protein LTR22_017551 [Elasticomyces elasticus]KAK3646148.1 hypothetical protein LTR56_008766 [Elasticomyces elasticus]KAK4924329.1 hypothetical protein LTR49_008630 [Elasticomyces elasticus]KAK5759113.1 hypothetical protein LTS12_010721 [Elasticomyces elasticus]